MEKQSSYARRVLRITDLIHMTGMSKTHIYRLIRRGAFPPPRKVSSRMSIWDSEQVIAWIDLQFSTPVALAA